MSVSEKDYSKVKLGENATVQLVARSSVSLPAKVSYISPTASSQSGTATYAVKIDLQPLLSSTPGQSQTSAVSNNQTGPAPAYQLTQGTTVLVNIIVDHRENVLLVPNDAIALQSRQSVVSVLADNQTQVRQIRTGIADWQYTEVTSGLSEGEQVVFTPPTARPTTTTSAGQSQRQIQQLMPRGGATR